jgi:hypothetical protein
MRDKMRVTINQKGAIMLNRKAFEELGSPVAVELSFVTGHSEIGIKPTDPDAVNAFPVVPKAAGSSCRINAGPLCLAHDIRIEKTTLFLEPVINPEGILELKLAKTMWVTRGSN